MKLVILVVSVVTRLSEYQLSLERTIKYFKKS